MVAARALHVTMRGGTVDDLVPSDDGPIPLWKLHTLGLRSMLQVLREPTVAMSSAGSDVECHTDFDEDGRLVGGAAADVWRAMIDAILAEPDLSADGSQMFWTEPTPLLRFVDRSESIPGGKGFTRTVRVLQFGARVIRSTHPGYPVGSVARWIDVPLEQEES